MRERTILVATELMVPKRYAPGKMIVHEENIAVTSGGPRLLTRRAPRELPVIW
jgi:hypothetical protein